MTEWKFEWIRSAAFSSRLFLPSHAASNMHPPVLILPQCLTHRPPQFRICVGAFLLILIALLSQSPIQAGEHEFYLKSVKPVLQARCIACHGALKQEANLRLDTVSSMLVGGESGRAIQSGDSKISLLVQRITAYD